MAKTEKNLIKLYNLGKDMRVKQKAYFRSRKQRQALQEAKLAEVEFDSMLTYIEETEQIIKEENGDF